MYWPRLLVNFQEIQYLVNFHYDAGCQGLEIDPCIKFCFPQSFSLPVTCTYMYIVHMPIKKYWPRLSSSTSNCMDVHTRVVMACIMVRTD